MNEFETIKINAAINELLDATIRKTAINSGGIIAENFKDITLTIQLPSELLQAVEEVYTEITLENFDQILSLLISTLIGIGYNTRLKEMIKRNKK